MLNEIILNSSFDYDPANPIFSLPNLSVQWMKVKEVIVPNITKYPVNEGNNKIVFFEDDGTQRTIAVPPGFHNQATFPVLIQDLMNAAGNQTYTVTFDNSTKKITIESSAPFKIASASMGTTAYRVLGSDRDQTPNKQLSHTMPFQVDLSNTGVFLLCSNSLTSQSISYCAGQSNMKILCSIPNTQSGQTIHYEPDMDWMFVGSSISQLDLYIIDATTHQSIPGFRGSFVVRLEIADELDDVAQ